MLDAGGKANGGSGSGGGRRRRPAPRLEAQVSRHVKVQLRRLQLAACERHGGRRQHKPFALREQA